jgi:hypothetical protein
MSLNKYIKKRNCEIIIESKDQHQDLFEHLSGLVIRKQSNILEIKKHFINCLELEKKLHEINYPFVQSMILAVRSASSSQINKAQNKFYEWLDGNENDVSKKINSNLIAYKANLKNENLNPQEADEIFKNIVSNSGFFIDKIKFKLNKVSEKLNFKEAVIYPVFNYNDFDEIEFKIKVKEHEFLFSKNNVAINENNDFTKEFCKTFNDQNPQMLTLYFLQESQKRNYFEQIKRNISLGINSDLPPYIEFYKDTQFKEDFDLWKVKIKNKYIVESEGKFFFNGSDRFIKWIERVDEK